MGEVITPGTQVRGFYTAINSASTIERWYVEKKLGEGGFGAVFKVGCHLGDQSGLLTSQSLNYS
ncbi:hypothetical protein GCK32_022509, partial [Trichostrongylus colubriformis]